MAKITVASGEEVLCEVVLAKECITIGRAHQNEVVIDDPAISGQHAVITSVQGDSLLEDLDSTNGTKVNGQPVKTHFLQDGDIIEFANYTMRYTCAPEENHASARSSHRVTRQGGSDIAVIRVLSGSNVGKELLLNKPITTIGRPGNDIAVISKRPNGYFIVHIDGKNCPMVNGKPVGFLDHPVLHGDVIDMAGIQMRFIIKRGIVLTI